MRALLMAYDRGSSGVLESFNEPRFRSDAAIAAGLGEIRSREDSTFCDGTLYDDGLDCGTRWPPNPCLSGAVGALPVRLRPAGM